MKKNKQEKAIAYWEKMQKRGVIKHTLIIGGVFALIASFLPLDFDEFYLFSETDYLLKFIGKIVLSSVLFGIATWWIAKWQYNKAIKQNKL